MALDKIAGAMPGLNSNILEGVRGANSGMPSAGQAGKADEFKRALEQAVGASSAAPAAAPTVGLAKTGQIAGAQSQAAISNLKFSNHALERMRSRGIHFQPEELRNIGNAVNKAAAKGAKDTLVLSGDNALIVSVKNNMVVTVMDRQAMKENVFTNIDSTVVI